MNNLTSVQIYDIIRNLEQQIRQLRIIASRSALEEAQREAEFQHQTRTLNPCSQDNCNEEAIYLGRCEQHPHGRQRSICTTCNQAAYTGHNTDCNGRTFVKHSDKELAAILDKLRLT